MELILEWVYKPNPVPVPISRKALAPEQFGDPVTVIHLGGELLRSLERPTRRS